MLSSSDQGGNRLNFRYCRPETQNKCDQKQITSAISMQKSMVLYTSNLTFELLGTHVTSVPTHSDFTRFLLSHECDANTERHFCDVTRSPFVS